jgi:hypothetical protein
MARMDGLQRAIDDEDPAGIDRFVIFGASSTVTVRSFIASASEF